MSKEDYETNGICYAALGEFVDCINFEPCESYPKECKFWYRCECRKRQEGEGE